jgi:hypothetical protein
MNYRGHWSFVTGVSLSTLAFAALGGEIDEYISGRNTEDLGFRVFLVVTFLTFGVLSFWSAQRLHRCSVELDRSRKELGANEALQATPAPPTS